jgi:hypothetical protein
LLLDINDEIKINPTDEPEKRIVTEIKLDGDLSNER